MATFSFNWDTRIMTLDAPDTNVTVQEVFNAAKTEQAKLENGDDYVICRAEGKLQITASGTRQVVTIVFLHDWRFAFEARLGPDWVLCSITDGIVVAQTTDGDTRDSPFYPTAYVVPSYAAAVSGALLNDLGSVDVQQAMTDQGYTTTRAPKLDNLDDTISNVITDVAAVQSAVDGIDTAVGALPGDVLEEAVLSHYGVAGSLAQYISRMFGALHLNSVVRDFTYDPSTNKLTGATIRVYNSKANAQADDGSTGLIHTYTMDAEHLNDLASLFRLVVDS